MGDFNRESTARTLAGLAAQGLRIGTSSWKYAGWCGQLYDASRYEYRGKFAEKRFDQGCLKEYAEVFQTVSVDAAYYKFPDHKYLEGLCSQTGENFQFGFKVTDEITIKRYANLPRFGIKAGHDNPNFLNPDLFATAFLEPCEAFRAKVGLLMFEFSHFHPRDFERGRDFVAALDSFLARIPSGWPYAVEIRNKSFLHPEYFGMLQRNKVAHVFNNWQGMPTVAEQRAMPGSQPHPELIAARFLLKPGRKYEEAVRMFSPYDKVKEVSEEGRAAGAQIIRDTASAKGKVKGFVFVNNRFEGNSLQTIQAMLEQASG